MSEALNNLVKKFQTTPFLFIGSGLTRRYLNLPNWEELLKHFCNKLPNNEYKFVSLKRKAHDDYAELGSLLENEFNDIWYNTPDIRSNDPFVEKNVSNGYSPFKTEVAYFIDQHSKFNDTYTEEIAALRRLTERNISGIITTNYDKFAETIAPKYNVFTNQESLIFSSLHGFGEIYKIHGTTTEPDSIILTKSDYDKFDSKSKYLAAKLLTIFVEYPIIFLGYSISDENIRKILSEIVNCIPKERLDELHDKFIFIKHTNSKDIIIESLSMDLSGIQIPMTVVKTDNYLALYNALYNKKAGYPVHMLRLFSEGLYEYALTGVESKYCVVEPYNKAVSEDLVIFSLGIQRSDKGYTGITAEDWHKNVIFDNLNYFSADEILSKSFHHLNFQNIRLPFFKLLSQAKLEHKDLPLPQCFDDLITNSVKKVRDGKNFSERSVKGILKDYSDTNRRCIYLPYLKEDEINVNDLEKFLRDLLSSDPDIIYTHKNKADIKRLIRIYDWLKYR